jgi:hypothetical protein
VSAGTSARAWSGLGILVTGYLAIAVVAGARTSPLTVPSPAGARPPSWATGLARDVGLDHLGRSGLTAIAWVVVAIVLAAFAVVLVEAWRSRVALAAVLVASAASLAISVAAPLLLSRDVYTYAGYGRIEALHHANPYVATLSSLRGDPFVAVTPGQWVHTHSSYGPVFTLLSAAVTRLWAGAPGTTILVFKLLAGLAIAAATACAALAARRTRPERAPFAAALVGLSPVLVIHTVGGGHVDALVAGPLAAALALAVTRPPPRSARALATTGLVMLACLVKTVVAPVLLLWLWWLVRERSGRARTIVVHAAVVAAPAIAAGAPFVDGRRTFRPFVTLGGVEAWASPSHLVGLGAQALAGGGAMHAVEAAFLLLFVVSLWRLVRRIDPARPTAEWGPALLLLALSLPYLLPWYAAWFAPFVALMADGVFLAGGVVATVVLGLTLIPADPFHGLTSPAVMDGVHYGAASVLLVALAALAARVLSPGARAPAAASGTAPRDRRPRSAALPR